MTASRNPAAPRRAALAVSLAALAAPRVAAHTGVLRADTSGVSGSGAATAGHTILLRDSVFDNEAYVGGGPDVLTRLRGRLPAGWRCTLATVDGAVVGDVPLQVRARFHQEY